MSKMMIRNLQLHNKSCSSLTSFIFKFEIKKKQTTKSATKPTKSRMTLVRGEILSSEKCITFEFSLSGLLSSLCLRVKNKLKEEVVREGFVLEKALMWLMGKYSIRTAAVNMLWNTQGINCFALQRFEACTVISETFPVMLCLSRSTIVFHVSVRSLKEQSLTKRDVLIMSHVLFFLTPVSVCFRLNMEVLNSCFFQKLHLQWLQLGTFRRKSSSWLPTLGAQIEKIVCHLYKCVLWFEGL